MQDVISKSWGVAREVHSADGTYKHYVWNPADPRGHRTLLAMTVANPQGDIITYHAVTDANGNVTRLFDSIGDIAGRFEYGPFGEMLRATGPAAEQCPFRYSSEYWDAETELYYYGHRYYSPRQGRWLSKDPIEEQGGLNLYGFVGNNTPNKYDVLGMWGADVHYVKTKEWAESVGYPTAAAEAIGKANDAVDYGVTGPMPSQDQSYHFNRDTSGNFDSRIQHYIQHLRNAKNYCSDATNKDMPIAASIELGTALHPFQDIIAHGDYEYRNGDNIRVWHNMASDQVYLGFPPNFPDDPNLDAIGDPHGIPTKQTLKWSPLGDYAYYMTGRKRITLTKTQTTEALQRFRDYIRIYAKHQCKCRKHFGVLW